ncbi:MAG: hypothetical protein ABID64_02755 [Nitrospirota bacterium]
METKKENSPENLKEVPTSELIDTFREALETEQKINPELRKRGHAFLKDVLSKVDNFPIERLIDCSVYVRREKGVAIVINVPMPHLSPEQNFLVRHRGGRLELKEAISNLPGVDHVEINGLMENITVSLDVVLQPDHIPAQDPSQTVEEVQENVGEKLTDV